MTKGEVKSREDAVEQGRAVESINANASQLWRAAWSGVCPHQACTSCGVQGGTPKAQRAWPASRAYQHGEARYDRGAGISAP